MGEMPGWSGEMPGWRGGGGGYFAAGILNGRDG